MLDASRRSLPPLRAVAHTAERSTEPPASFVVSELLAVRGRLRDREIRAIGIAAARHLDELHSEDRVHGDLRPESLVVEDTGRETTLGLTDASRSPGPGSVAADDIRALVAVLVHYATGRAIDRRVDWSAPALTILGCSPSLARDLADASAAEPTADGLIRRLLREPSRLPDAPNVPRVPATTPTVRFVDPVWSTIEPIPQPRRCDLDPEPPGWMRSARAALSRMRPGRGWRSVDPEHVGDASAGPGEA